MDRLLFDHIQSLEKGRSNWKIKVRVTRFWPTIAADTNVVRGYNMILLDEDNSHIHAYAYPDNWNAINKPVVEGNVYMIENFQVRDSIGRLRPVSNKLCIRLLNSTTIEQVDNDAMIPAHKFEFMDLGDLLEEAKRNSAVENPEFSIDVIGAVIGFVKVQKIPTRIGERDVVYFKLTDGSEYHKVTVWGDLARTVSDDYTSDLEKPVIAVMSSTKVTMFREYAQIGTIPSTKVFFNPDIDAVKEMRNRLLEASYNSEEASAEFSNSQTVVRNTLIRTTFKELADNALAFFAQPDVVVTFTIKQLEEGTWWYFGCNTCHEEVDKIDRKFKCEICKRSFPYAEKRFRIMILADDNTLATNVMLMDRVVKRVIRTTATNIINALKSDHTDGAAPDALKDLVGKDITVKIHLSESNIKGDSNIYQATDVFDPTAQENQIYDHSPIPKCPSFSQSESVNGIGLFDTPESVKNTALKKIKIEDSPETSTAN